MKQALLLIDIQNDYFAGGRYPLPGQEAAAAQAARLLALARRAKLPVFHIRHISGAEAPFFATGTAGSEIHPSVAPLPGETVLEKHAPNSFFGTGLADRLRVAGIEKLVVCGSMVPMCVDTTVRAARDFGLSVELVWDACAGPALCWGGESLTPQTACAAYFAGLSGSFARLLSCDEWLDENS